MSGAVPDALAGAVVISDGEPLCPVCGVPLPRHHITKYYNRRYDLWSDPMAARGLTCVVVNLLPYPADAERPDRPRPPRGRRTGAKEGTDFHDPDLHRRGPEVLRRAKGRRP